MGTPRFATTGDLISSFPSAGAFLLDEGSAEGSLAFIDRCMGQDRADLAISYCAFLLPRREAVWWGCACMADVDALTEAERGCVGLARDWALRPDETKRRRALERGLEFECTAVGNLDGAGGRPVRGQRRGGRRGAGPGRSRRDRASRSRRPFVGCHASGGGAEKSYNESVGCACAVVYRGRSRCPLKRLGPDRGR